MSEIETKKYTITGLVDFTDEQGNIVGQLEVGSVQELPVEVGDKAVAEGRAEVFEGEEEVAEAAPGTTGAAAPEEEEVASDAPGADDDNADLDEEDEDEDEDESEDDDESDEDEDDTTA